MILTRHPVASAAAALILVSAAPAAAGELTVTVTNAEPEGGLVSIAVYGAASADAFPREADPVARSQQIASGQTVSLTFHDLPVGDYAVAGYQDTNQNGELDTNLTGVPSEPSGFSQGATGTMGPPSFDAAAVTVTADGTATDIPLSE